MANIEHLGKINQGVGAWNTWRTENPEVLPDLEDVYLRGANLRDANLRDAYLGDANLERANLERANLRDANLRNTNLEGANLERANLRDAYLGGANLERANLERANLEGANLERANLRNAYLERADLGGANLRGAYLPTGETWEVYLTQTLPAYLTAGGKTIKDFINAEGVLECHSWNNCPTAFAFGCSGMEGVPILLRPRAEQFIQLWDQGQITRVHIEGLM